MPVRFVAALVAALILSDFAEASGPPFRAPLGDNCLVTEGYAAFRAELVEVARRGDGPAFQRLFMRTGGMRVGGMGGRGEVAGDWGWNRPQAALMWRELDALLPLGCAPQRDKLILPALSLLVDDPRVEHGTIAAVRATRAYARPARLRAGSRAIPAGRLLTRVREVAPGWIEVDLNRRPRFVPKADVRSIHDYQLVLKREQGRWRTWEFNSGV